MKVRAVTKVRNLLSTGSFQSFEQEHTLEIIDSAEGEDLDAQIAALQEKCSTLAMKELIRFKKIADKLPAKVFKFDE